MFLIEKSPQQWEFFYEEKYHRRIICTSNYEISRSSSLCLYIVLGGQTGSRGIHQQIVQRAQLLTHTLPCAFSKGKKAFNLMFLIDRHSSTHLWSVLYILLDQMK